MTLRYSTADRKMKVALIQQFLTAYRARFFEKLSERLLQKGQKLTVFFSKPQRGLTYSGIVPMPKTLSGFSFDYKVLPRIAYEGKLPTSPFHFKRSFIFSPTLIFEIARKRYDITISDGTGELLNIFPLLLVHKILLRKGFILWCGNNLRDNAPKTSDSIIKKIAHVFARVLYKHCDASIAYGPASKLFDIYMGTDPSKIFIALNTVDTLFFEETIKTRRTETENLRKKLGIVGKKCILYVGVLEKRKKVDNLVLSFKQLKKSMNYAALLIVGDGPHREFLHELCAKEEVQDIHFLGKIDYRDIPLCYALCDVFVLPSQGGITVAEAMACGKPVLVTQECNALRSIPNLVRQGENGFILKEDDIASLTEHMAKVLFDPDLARRMGAKSKEMAEKHFSTEKMLQGFEQAIDYVVADRRR